MGTWRDFCISMVCWTIWGWVLLNHAALDRLIESQTIVNQIMIAEHQKGESGK